MNVYHGSNSIVDHPDTTHSYHALDFGQGFYVTTNLLQAERWARRKADLFGETKAFVNQYQMSDAFDGLRVRTFSDTLYDWIDFVCDCRDDKEDYRDYDVIIGKVADDRVFRVVDIYYHSRLADKIQRGAEGIQYLDYKVLARLLYETEPELFV